MELGKKTIQTEKPPDIGEVKKFWQNILQQEVKHITMPNGSRTRRKNCSKSTRWSGRTSQLKNSGSTQPEEPTGNHLDMTGSPTSGSNSSRASTNPLQKHTQKSSRT